MRPWAQTTKKYTVEEAKAYLLKIFRGFDNDLANMVERAFDEAWIDFYPREGKVGGAFCANLDGHNQSRVLTNFDGSFSDIVTLAHELGHAFHNLNIAGHRPLNNDYSMPVAETASTFNENVIMNAAIEAAETDEEKLFLIESQLQDAAQIMCDIYSRYLFETSVFENRENDFMPADRLCELMLDAQRRAYGNGLDPETLHPYMCSAKGIITVPSRSIISRMLSADCLQGDFMKSTCRRARHLFPSTASCSMQPRYAPLRIPQKLPELTLRIRNSGKTACFPTGTMLTNSNGFPKN